MPRRKINNRRLVNRDRTIVDDNGFTNVYVGGYTSNPESEIAANGYGVYWGPMHSCNVSGGTRRYKISKFKHSTLGEVHSAYLALKEALRLKEVKKLRLNTSSKFLYDAMTRGISYWKTNKWLDEEGKRVGDRTSWERLDKVICKNRDRKVIEFKYIASPSDDEHQSQADQLAKAGAERC